MCLYGHWTHLKVIKNNFRFTGILSPEAAITRFLKIVTLQSPPNRFEWALGGLFFNLNHLNGHSPQFSPLITRLRRKKLILRGNNSMIAPLNFWQTPEIIFLTCPSI